MVAVLTFRVWARDDVGRVIAPIPGIIRFTAKRVWAGVGSWQLDLADGNPLLPTLLPPVGPAPGLIAPVASPGGIVVTALIDGVDVACLSGPVEQIQADAVAGAWTLSGRDDWKPLDCRIAAPNPWALTDPSTTQMVLTGPATSLLCDLVRWHVGPGALAERRIDRLTIDDDPVAGTTVTVTVTRDNLAAVLATICRQGGVDLALISRLDGTLVVTARPIVDRSATVAFSLAAGSLSQGQWTYTIPAATYVLAGGAGDGTDRVYGDATDDTIGETRAEEWFDASSNTDVLSTVIAAADELAKQAAQVSIAAAGNDVTGPQWLLDWQLGDLVTVDVGLGATLEQVTAVDVTLDGSGAYIVPTLGGRPIVGAAGVQGVLAALVAELVGLRTRVATLERSR